MGAGTVAVATSAERAAAVEYLVDVDPGTAKVAMAMSRGKAAALKLTDELRRSGVSVDLGFRGKMKQRMKRANNINARAAVILGDDELEQNAATVRDLDSGEQELVPLTALRDRLEQFR